MSVLVEAKLFWSLKFTLGSHKDPKRRTEVNHKIKYLLRSLPRILRKEVGNSNIAQEVSSTVYEVTKKTSKETDNQNKF